MLLMAAMANNPFATPSAKHCGLDRPCRPDDSAHRDRAHACCGGEAAVHHSVAQRCALVSFRTAARPPRDKRHGDHADEDAAVLDAAQLRGFSGRHVEHNASEWLEDEILRVVGQHRYEDEDGEAARLRL